MKLIILTFVILGLLLGIRYTIYFQNVKTYKAGDTFNESAVLLSEPKVSEFSQSFRVKGLLIQTGMNLQLHYGDSVKISGSVSEDTFESSGKTVSLLVVKNPDIILVPSNPLVQSAAFFRKRIVDTFNAYLPHKESILLFGIVFGGSQGFGKDMQDAFRNAGVLHVVAASGMNVTMVASFLLIVLSRFLRRQTALIITICGVFYYALLSGFSPSIVRASIMATVAFSAGIFGRQSYGFLALFLTVFIMLMINPETLFDAGFLLSFTATLGILFCKPLFDSIKFIQRTEAVSDDITTSLSAQMGSIPVLTSIFGGYSYISILVNALVLWTIPFLMILGGIAALCAITVPFVSLPLLYLCYPLLLYFELIIQYFGKIPMITISAMPWTFIVGYYLILTSLILFFKKIIKPASPIGGHETGIKEMHNS